MNAHFIKKTFEFSGSQEFISSFFESYLKKYKVFIFDYIIIWIYLVNPQQCMKNGTKLFQAEGFFFVKSDFDKRCQNEIEDTNEKICNRSKNKLSHKIDFRAFDLHKGQPAAWE